MAASVEDLRGGGLVLGPPVLNGDEEEEEDSPAVSSGVHLQTSGCFTTVIYTLLWFDVYCRFY